MTAIGCPLFVRRPGTSSQFDACGFDVNARRSCAPIELSSTEADPLPPPSPAVSAGATNFTDPGSGSASPRFENEGVVSYGKRLPLIVVGASGSFFDRKSAHA